MSHKLLLTAALAGIMLSICAVRVSAQELVHLPAGSFCRLNELLQNETRIKAAAVTLLPDNAVLWLDNKPLPAYQPIAARDLGRVFLFSAGEAELGVTICSDQPIKSPAIRIKSVNPYFSEKYGQTDV